MAAHDPDHKPEKWTKNDMKYEDEDEEETEEEACDDTLVQEDGEDGQSYMVLEVRVLLNLINITLIYICRF